MGWKLVREILDCSPDIKYREFRVLVALALDARDETRQGMPGTELLTLQANCKLRQTRQAIAGLKARGIIKTARRAAPGVRAIYEILPLRPVDNSQNGCGHSRTRTSAESGVTGAESGSTGAGISAHTQSLSLSHITQSSISRPHHQLLAIDAGVTERETTEILQILTSRGARKPAAVLHSEIANGNGHALIMEARHRLDAVAWLQQRSATPSVPDLQTPSGTEEKRRQLSDALTAWQLEHERQVQP
jgi:hypothetical protein